MQHRLLFVILVLESLLLLIRLLNKFLGLLSHVPAEGLEVLLGEEIDFILLVFRQNFLLQWFSNHLLNFNHDLMLDVLKYSVMLFLHFL
jgi:hypothetical protein